MQPMQQLQQPMPNMATPLGMPPLGLGVPHTGGYPPLPGSLPPLPGSVLPPLPGGLPPPQNLMLAQFPGAQPQRQMGTGPHPTFGMTAGTLNPALAPQQQFGGAPQAMGNNTNPTLAALLSNIGQTQGHPSAESAANAAAAAHAEAALKQHSLQQAHQAHQQAQQQAQQQAAQQAQLQADRARQHEDEKHRNRRGETKEQVESREKLAEAEKMKCHLHKKPKDNCKFCKKYQELVASAQKKGSDAADDRGREGRRRHGRKPDRAISEDRDNDNRRGPLELANQKTFGFSGLLQMHVVECAHFKSLLTLETFEQLADETYQFANSVEPYMANSGTLPSALFCCLYRFFTLGLDHRQLRRLIDSQESPYIRCCGLLYVRFGLPHDQILSWLSEYVLDDEEFKPSPDSEWRTSIGEYVEGLLSQDKYYNTVLPRLPMVTKRHVEEKLAPLGQNRKRMKQNKGIIDTFREGGTKVECSIGGEWLYGTLIELEEDVPTRPKVRVRLEDGSEEYVHLGKVILGDSRGGRARSGSRGRRGVGGYGRSRSRSPRVDWSRDKGRSDKELVEEMRSREREKAVCSTGKDYARKPVGYKAACALPREQGAASYRLMEEETFVPMNRQKRARTPSPEQENHRPSAEHQARMQQLFEKYGNAKGSTEERRHDDGVDRPDVMRLG